jgi:hypothetical protein
VTVVLTDCGSPCAEIVDIGCEAALEGNAIVVHAWEEVIPPGHNETCEAMCAPRVATCDTELLADGEWTLEYAGDVQSFEIPDADGSWPVCAEP